jgi:hypothetical protein
MKLPRKLLHARPGAPHEHHLLTPGSSAFHEHHNMTQCNLQKPDICFISRRKWICRLDLVLCECSEMEDKALQQSGIIEELQQHIGHLEHLLEIEAASRKNALSTHKVPAQL